MFGCFFAYETRNVTISALNDSKYIGISVYNVLIMCSSGAAIAFIVQNQNAALILITLFIFFCTSITLCLVFLPKVLEVRQDPSGKKNQKPKSNFKKVANNKESFLKAQHSSTQDFEQKTKFLSDENRRKQTILEQLNDKLRVLIKHSIDTNCLYLKECIEFIQCQDEQTKKILDDLNIFNLIKLCPSLCDNKNLNSDRSRIMNKNNSTNNLTDPVCSNNESITLLTISNNDSSLKLVKYLHNFFSRFSFIN